LIENFGDKPSKRIDQTVSSMGKTEDSLMRMGKVEQAMLLKIN